MSSTSPEPKRSKPIAPPKGTRDLYPEDALRRRYVQQAWRDASIRCGFDEIAGPTFETSELYSVKSGEGILSELFQAYSGKSPEEVEQVKATGRAPYAMRPEFTPTLARMYAAKAGSLPRPCKWFTAGPYFRAERPQRGRLREFEQWNVDVIGLPGEASSVDAAPEEVDAAKAEMDAECIGCNCQLLSDLGLSERDASVGMSDRGLVEQVLGFAGVKPELMSRAMELLDRRAKLGHIEFVKLVAEVDLNVFQFDYALHAIGQGFDREKLKLVLRRTSRRISLEELFKNPPPPGPISDESWNAAIAAAENYEETTKSRVVDFAHINRLFDAVEQDGLRSWCKLDQSVVRGLAYYTGTVFEVIAEGERAVAGGGRYDNLIELMGGPPTPAVGFAMGDVVLSLLLDDKGLMPEGADLLDAVSRRPASVRPDVFVLGADDDATDPLVRRLAADLRRGVESKRWSESDDRKPWARDRYDADTGGVLPLHARVSYKSTRNLKKLLADGEKQFARYAAVVHGADRVELKDLDARRSLTPADVPGMDPGLAEFSVTPDHPAYIGRAVTALTA